MKNVQKLLAPVFMLCMFTSCAPAVESSSISTLLITFKGDVI